MSNSKQYRKDYKLVKVIILIIMILIAMGLFGYLIINGMKIAKENAKKSYETAVQNKKNEVYEKYYDVAYKIGYNKYHVENQVSINIEDIKEKTELEVLQVSSVAYAYSEENKSVWTAVRGHGVYTVDLSLSEVLIDNARRYVLIRVPHPKLSRSGLDYEYENFYFESGLFNGCARDGVEHARETLSSAKRELWTTLSSNQGYYGNAEKSAKRIIENLVKKCNPDISGITVEVEWTD